MSCWALDSADSGTITIDGQSVGKMNEKQLTSYRRRNLGYIFQSYNLIPNLTVRENIEVGAYLGDSPLDLDELISVLGLENHQDKLPSQLSGGQQQRMRRTHRRSGFRHIYGNPEADRKGQSHLRKLCPDGHP